MQGELKEFNNEFNLFDYFSRITLMQTEEKSIWKENAILWTNFEKDKCVQFSFEEVYQQVIKINNFIFEQINFKNDLEDEKKRLIGVYLKTDEFTVQVLLGILSLGLTYLPIDPTMPRERINYILNDAKPLCVISNIKNDIIEDYFKGTNVLFLNDIFNKNNEKQNNNKIEKQFEFDPNAAACLIYTSGSTGMPKGVLISHKSIMNRLNWQWATFTVSSENSDIGALKTSLNFGDHIAEIFAFVLKGLPLCIIGPEVLSTPLRLLNLIETFKITYFICVPSVLKNIIMAAVSSKQTDKLNSVKRWVCSGEELTMSLLNSFWNMNLNNGTIVSNLYGSTELTADLTFVSFNSRDQMRRLLNEETILPIGRPISNSKFYLLDENLNKVEIEGEIGEIYAGGVALAIGYLHDEKNESRFVEINNERLFRTGDYGFVKNDLLYFSGRKDTQIKIRGKRVDLNDLTFIAHQLEYIESFLPLTVNINSDTKIIAYYIAKKNCLLCEAQLNELIVTEFKLKLLDYVIPNYLFKLNENFPMLYNGKVDKQMLISEFKEKVSIKTNNESHDKESMSIIDKILNIIQSTTGINYKKLHNNDQDISKLSLQALGLHSLNVFEIYLTLNKIENSNFGGSKISFEDFLSCQNICEIASLLQVNLTINQVETTQFNSKNKFNGTSVRVEFLNKNKGLIGEINEMICENFLSSNPLFKHESFNKELFLKELKICDSFFQNSQESFVFLDTEQNDLLGGAILFNFNLMEEYPDPISAQYLQIQNALQFLLQNSLQKVNKNAKKILWAEFVFVKKMLLTNEKPLIMVSIEKTIIRIARQFNYDAILVVNSNPLTNVSI